VPSRPKYFVLESKPVATVHNQYFVSHQLITASSHHQHPTSGSSSEHLPRRSIPWISPTLQSSDWPSIEQYPRHEQQPWLTATAPTRSPSSSPKRTSSSGPALCAVQALIGSSTNAACANSRHVDRVRPRGPEAGHYLKAGGDPTGDPHVRDADNF